MDSEYPCFGLDILKKAAHFVENQQQDTTGENEASSPNRPVKTPQTSSSVTENGYPGQRKNPSYYRPSSRSSDGQDTGETQSFHFNKKIKQLSNTEKDNTSRESMLLSENNSADEASTMAHFTHHNNGLVVHPRTYSAEHRPSPYRRERSTESPTHSPARKTSPPHTTEGDLLRPVVLPPGTASQPLPHVATANPMIPFIHPLMYPTMDPSMCADALARQAASINSERQQTSNTPPATTVPNGAIPAQGLPGLMFPFTNPALLMGARGSNVSGIGVPDLPMVFPSPLAAYGPAAGMIPQQLSALASLSEQDKRFYETMPHLAQQVTTNLLANPYLKGFCPSGFESLGVKDTRSMPKTGLAAGVGIAGIPYNTEFMLKYQEAVNNEALKFDGSLSSRVAASPAPLDPRLSNSPDNSKKTPISAYTLPVPFASSLHNASSSSSQPPLSDRSTSTASVRSLRNGTPSLPHFDARPPTHLSHERDIMYHDSHDVLASSEASDARRRLITFSQRPTSIHTDSYSSHHKSPLHRRSPSPYNDRRELRRFSRELSPSRTTPSSEKVSKKQSNEAHGISRDHLKELKRRSPSVQSSHGVRSSKSPSVRRSNSPREHASQAHEPIPANYFAALAAKSGQGPSDKDSSSFIHQASPYIFHPTLGGLTASPFTLPYLRQTEVQSSSSSKALADATSWIFRPPLPPEAMAEYARLTGMSPSAVALMMPQQQSFRPPLVSQSTPTSQNLLLERDDKERIASPVAAPFPAAASMLSYFQSPAGVTSKLPRGSPISGKVPQKHSLSFQQLSVPHAYRNHPRTSPGPLDEGESRFIKRETSPSPVKRSSVPGGVYGAQQQKTDNLSTRRIDEEKRNRLKRRADDEKRDRFSPKDSMLKRKREVTSDANAPDIEEHFRRSLGENYKDPETTNTVTITANVDDHFRKALGNDVWSKMKPGYKCSSPEPTDAMPNGRENYYPSTATTNMLPHSFSNLYVPHLQRSTENRSFISYTDSSLKNSATKVVQARGIVFPEPKIEVPPTNGAEVDISSSGTGVSRASPRRSEGFVNPADFESEGKVRSVLDGSRLQPSPSATSPLAQEKPLALQRSTNHPSLVHPPPPPYTISSTDSKSCARSSPGPPPAYSPSSSNSVSLLPASSSPGRTSSESKSVNDTSTSSSMSVQTKYVESAE
ncbi:uncharacterized protein LOC143450270 isoform X1 [Clavelina lepadiformis]|uniref:uncharacterized protein LOC143450270 isoform X1 n=2 Tax=Clavelina lepadiformis TaxID=159417 RepID=UPI0040430635